MDKSSELMELEECPFCFDEILTPHVFLLDDNRMTCNHIYCEKCAEECVKTKQCPTCKKEIIGHRLDERSLKAIECSRKYRQSAVELLQVMEEKKSLQMKFEEMKSAFEQSQRQTEEILSKQAEFAAQIKLLEAERDNAKNEAVEKYSKTVKELSEQRDRLAKLIEAKSEQSKNDEAQLAQVKQQLDKASQDKARYEAQYQDNAKALEEEKEYRRLQEKKMEQNGGVIPSSPSVSSSSTNVASSTLASLVAVPSFSSLFNSTTDMLGNLAGKIHSQFVAPPRKPFQRIGSKRNSKCYISPDNANMVCKKIELHPYVPIELPPNNTALLKEEMDKNAAYFALFREPMLLSLFNHPNIVPYKEPVVVPDRSICLETPLLGHDLGYYAAEVLSGMNPDEAMAHIQSIIAQLLKAVNYLHHHSVFHLNIKPSSVLVNPYDGSVTLTSFSRARSLGAQLATNLNLEGYEYNLPYLSPQFAYAAEDIIRARKRNTVPRNAIKINWKQVDMWAIGCVLASLIGRGTDLFEGVKSAEELKSRVKTVKGPSSINDFLIRAMKSRPRRSMPDLGSASKFPEACGLLLDLLQEEPENRPSAAKALASPFIGCPNEIVQSPLDARAFGDENLPNYVLSLKGLPVKRYLADHDRD